MTDASLKEFGLRTTRELLESAAKAIRKTATSPDHEAVHKMRVSIRRFQQALRLFRQFLRRKGVDSVRAELRAIMVEAGNLRNHDIALSLAGNHRSVSKYLTEQRKLAEAKVAAALAVVAGAWLAERWKEELGLSADDVEKAQ